MTRPPVYGLLAEFEGPNELIAAVRQAREAGYRRLDAFTPFPIEELSEALGAHRNLLPLIVLIGGITGMAVGIGLQYWTSVVDYPINVAGRPLFSLPSFVPITFECTILFAALSAVLGMLALNGLPMPYHPLFNAPRFALASRDRFFLCIEATDPLFDSDATARFLQRLVPRSISEVDHLMNRHGIVVTAFFLPLLAVCACRTDMQNQPKYRPYRPSNFFADGRSERPAIPDTVARGHLNDDELLYAGKVDAALADKFPFTIGRDELRHGQERYNIYCSPCHDRAGGGNGMIVQRGYRRPPSLHIDRLRQQPAGYFFDVITNGFGVMPSYSQQIPVHDRWDIVAYVRALQLSQHAELGDLSSAERARLDQPQAPAAAPRKDHHE